QEPLDELRRRVQRQDAPVIEDGHAVAQVLRCSRSPTRSSGRSTWRLAPHRSPNRRGSSASVKRSKKALRCSEMPKTSPRRTSKLTPRTASTWPYDLCRSRTVTRDGRRVRVPAPAGSGLRGLRDWTDAIGGRLETGRGPGRGF